MMITPKASVLAAFMLTASPLAAQVALPDSSSLMIDRYVVEACSADHHRLQVAFGLQVSLDDFISAAQGYTNGDYGLALTASTDEAISHSVPNAFQAIASAVTTDKLKNDSAAGAAILKQTLDVLAAQEEGLRDATGFDVTPVLIGPGFSTDADCTESSLMRYWHDDTLNQYRLVKVLPGRSI